MSEEYEVETVIEAKLQTLSRKAKQKQKTGWQYRVKWKGYDASANTWEPVDSFQSSEEMLTRFWERVDVGGRDINDLSLFKLNEVFRPSGPPRKLKRKQSVKSDVLQEAASDAQAEPAEAKTSGKRRRSSPVVVEEDEPALKRKRGRPSTRTAESSASAALPKRKSVSRAAGEANSSISKAASKTRNKPSSSRGRKVPAPSSDEIILASPSVESVSGIMPRGPSPPVTMPETNLPMDDHESGNPLFGSPEAPPLPSHRARTAKPLVKMADDPNIELDNGIPTKTRLLNQTNGGEASSSSAPLRTPTRRLPRQAKNKSSLLTFTKTGLQTVKGKFMPSESKGDEHASPRGLADGEEVNGVGDDTMEVDTVLALDATPDKVPTGEELLEIAGLNKADVEALPDFEDDVPAVVPPIIEETPAQNSNVARAASSLFPTQSSSSLFNFGGSWTRASIFDPLGFGTSSSAVSPSSTAPTLPAFSLSLDSSVTVPIYLRDIFPETGAPSLGTVVAANPKGPPGKFYREEIASTLVNILRPGGSSARVEVNENVDENQKQHFERFRIRLEGGELFIGLAGHEVLAFWSSSNTDVGSKLGAPASLIGLPNIVAVSRVEIEDHSAYADVACKAEHVRW